MDRKRLRLWLMLFFLALAIPTGILIQQAYSQLKWEAFHQHQVLAEELTARVDGRFVQLVRGEEARSFSDYAFLVVAGDPAANFLQRSPLASYPVAATIPGLIGYFQVDSAGALSTPLLPPAPASAGDYGIPRRELDERLALAERIQEILSRNRLVDSAGTAGHKAALKDLQPRHDDSDFTSALTSTPSSEEQDNSGLSSLPGAALAPARQGIPGQAAFDRLNKAKAPLPAQAEKKQQVPGKRGRVEDLELDYSYQNRLAEQAQGIITAPAYTPIEKRSARKERGALPQPAARLADEAFEAETPDKREVRINTFESAIDPFEFSLLDSGHFVLFRKVWRDGQRYIQGALIEQQPFLNGVIESAFGETALSRMSDLIVAYQGEVFSAFSGRSARQYLSSAEDLSGALLYQTRLSAPLDGLELIFTVTHLPSGPGGTLVSWVAATLTLVLCGGFYLMYRLAARQIDLTRQQQDFVSAVSHELKTPLTSIRMYGEMLREGWTSEERKNSYYEYIHDESERLSRLINNVLQLARMTRNDIKVELKAVTVAELMDGVRSKIASQVEHAGFKLNLDCDEGAGKKTLLVDADAFSQIVINLVDNALKFAASAENKTIDIACRLLSDGTLQFSVRDYGPGIARDQMKKIFDLFYRSENELTRETVGTGIGLALVQQLAQAMQAQVDVVNGNPGVEFRICFSQ
jgi:signal transduction histidine kinase